MSRRTHLYFHSPCFDGIVSAVLIWDFLKEHQGRRITRLHPVNYHLRATWLSCDLERPCVVVDFLYHPHADFWADHHPTTFLTPAAEDDYERRKNGCLVYQPEASSCSGLLWSHLYNVFGYRKRRHTELVHWAEKTDAARYASVEEAIEASSPALRINASLAIGNEEGYCEFLVRKLRKRSLTDVAELPQVKERFEEFRARVGAGLARFKECAWVEDDGIVVFDVASDGTIISRYAPYHFFENARYSAGIVRSDRGAKITAMRNPWREFESVHLGKIFERYGGGGHQRVGAIVLAEEDAEKASRLLEHIKQDIRREDREGRAEVLS